MKTLGLARRRRRWPLAACAGEPQAEPLTISDVTVAGRPAGRRQPAGGRLLAEPERRPRDRDRRPVRRPHRPDRQADHRRRRRDLARRARSPPAPPPRRRGSRAGSTLINPDGTNAAAYDVTATSQDVATYLPAGQQPRHASRRPAPNTTRPSSRPSRAAPRRRSTRRPPALDPAASLRPSVRRRTPGRTRHSHEPAAAGLDHPLRPAALRRASRPAHFAPAFDAALAEARANIDAIAADPDAADLRQHHRGDGARRARARPGRRGLLQPRRRRTPTTRSRRCSATSARSSRRITPRR